jgi:chemotaxis protein methyltransferase CheR
MSVDYQGYRAKSVRQRGFWYRAARDSYRFLLHRVVFGTLLYPYGMWRHRRLIRTAERSQCHTFTCFFRSPAQLEAFTGPLMTHLAPAADAGSLRILLFACSTGAEAYTFASALRRAHPGLAFRIQASDLHHEMVDKATAGVYTRDEVFHSEHITAQNVQETFDVDGDRYRVKPSIRACVEFSQADLLDDLLSTRFESADVVVAQNVLFHLSPSQARRAFENIARFLKPRSVLLVEGMDLALKVSLTAAHGLQPLPYKCREIYEQSRSHIPLVWWRYYYGMEPYFSLRRDRLRRYGSIFVRTDVPVG